MGPTEQEILSARNTRVQLAEWGVPWPPPQGWRKRLLREARRANVKRDDGLPWPVWQPTKTPFAATITTLSGRTFLVSVEREL